MLAKVFESSLQIDRERMYEIACSRISSTMQSRETVWVVGKLSAQSLCHRKRLFFSSVCFRSWWVIPTCMNICPRQRWELICSTNHRYIHPGGNLRAMRQIYSMYVNQLRYEVEHTGRENGLDWMDCVSHLCAPGVWPGTFAFEFVERARSTFSWRSIKIEAIFGSKRYLPTLACVWQSSFQ